MSDPGPTAAGGRRAALEGVTVLDLTRLLPGAFCSQMLADLGADVIKIEQRGAGDYNRSWEPRARHESGSFLLLNRNKKSVTLDLKSDDGKRILRRLARRADILIEGFRPGVMDRLDLSYAGLAADNPRLIWCSISGYGQSGPKRLKAGHDLNYLAESGALNLFGKAGEGPIVPGLSIADVGGGSLMALSGILAALFARERGGEGQYIDVSMHDGVMAWLALHGADYLFGGVEPKGGERPFIGQAPCYNVYRCADGRYLALGLIEPHFWARFCTRLGLDDLVSQQWPSGEAVTAQRDRLDRIFATRSRDDWLAEFDGVDIPLGPVLDMAEAFADPHVIDREMLLHVDHAAEGRIPQLGFPIKFSVTPCTLRLPPPLLGEHTDEIMTDIGFSASEILDLRTRGVI